MAVDTPTFISPVPAVESIQEFIYSVSAQGLDSNNPVPDTLNGLDLLEYPPFSDPRVTRPAVTTRLFYNEKVIVTKKYEVPDQAPWFYGVDQATETYYGWFQKE